MGSISGAVGESNASIYSAGKAGLIGLTKSLALELAEYGITVNVINPGWVKTNLTDECIKSGNIDEQEELEMIPQKRWIEPKEVADLAQYLISESAQGITGQSLNLCGGLSLG
jgi:NAD(P)-dependent dehydrogenase (short-subunit alcohol dehydrogenase family)